METIQYFKLRKILLICEINRIENAQHFNRNKMET